MFILRRVSLVLGAGVVICTLAQGNAFASTIAYWQFADKAVGSTASVGDTVADSSGNAHNGAVSLHNMAYVAGAPGFDGTAIHTELNGIVDIPASSQFVFNDSFTIEVETRLPPDTASGTPTPFMDAGASSVAAIWCRLQPGSGDRKVGASLYTNPGWDWYIEGNGTTTVTDGNWHHIAIVYDKPGDVLRMYCDYNLEATVLPTIYVPGATQPASLGSGLENVQLLGDPTGSAYSALTGDVDFIRVSDVALDPSGFVHPVPEPSIMAMLATGSIGLLAYAWRKRRQ